RSLGDKATGVVDDSMGGGRPQPDVAAQQAAQGQQGMPPQQAPNADAATNAKISNLIGNLVFGIIIIVVAIAALQVLGIKAISDPAQQMLQIFLNAIPLIIAAGILLAIGFVIAKFLGNLLEQILEGIGTDKAINEIGIVPEGTSASNVITRIVQVAIMIFFAIMATRMLGFPEITNILNEILDLGGSVLFGAAIIAAGFLIAALIGKFITNSLASKVLRYSAIALFIAMGLRYMGLADSIINLAFGAVVIGGAAAAALAFGLGGRDAAARMLGKVDLDEAADAANTGSDSGATGGSGAGTSGASNSGPDTPGANGGAASAGDPRNRRTRTLRTRHQRSGATGGGSIGCLARRPTPFVVPCPRGPDPFGPNPERADPVKIRLWSTHRGDCADVADPPRRIDHKPRVRGGAAPSSGCLTRGRLRSGSR